jgi:hypothetical protein
MTIIDLKHGKPTESGDYLCLRLGNAHPEFARIRRYAGVLNYLTYGKDRVLLETIEETALFSEPIELHFSA